MKSLSPESRGEELAVFRSQVIGAVANRSFSHGELAAALRELSQQRFRPPGSKVTRSYSVPTLERWYYALKTGGLAALEPRPRSDRGHAQAIAAAERVLLCDIRQEHPTASAALILRTLETQGRLEKGVLSESTVRRLFEERGLGRLSRQEAGDTHTRLRWEAGHPGALWHGDVCHGPSLVSGSGTMPLRIHALLDDNSRFVVALEARSTEREDDMLSLLVACLRKHAGKPDALYLDNGSTYSGQALATACGRLSVSLIHAQPYDPQARGKMERFWRTLRGGLLDHLDRTLSLLQVQQRLEVFLARHYHDRPHASLFGKTPLDVWERRQLRPVTEDELRRALTVTERRRVSRDGVIGLAGRHYELRQGFLAGKIVPVTYNLIDGFSSAVVVYEGRRFPLFVLDTHANAASRRPKAGPAADAPSTPFDPNDPDMPF